MNDRVLATAIAIATCCASGPAAAQYRLRADAYVAAGDPTTGILMLTGEARRPSWLEAETVVWLGSGDLPADVLVAAVRARDPKGHGEVRVGRILVSAGAIRPVHMDGIDAVGRLPFGTSFEAFGGLPVAAADGPRDYDWVVGQRLAQRLGNVGTLGVSYLHMRNAGDISYQEAGFDATATPTKGFDGAFAGAYDLVSGGLTDARVSVAARFSALRLEAYAVRRAPSHLLPATSLFSALGDVPSDRAGGAATWRAAPRLDVFGDAAAESLAGQLGGHFALKTTLRLDDRGRGALGLEVRREGAPDASWVGIRGTGRVPLTDRLSAASEVELVAPDNSHGRGAVWPWALVALRFKPVAAWEIASAFEASASPTNVAALRAIFKLSYCWAAR